MSKAQNRNMGRKRRQGNMNNPWKGIIENLMESEADESPVADFRGMMIWMFNELKEKLKGNMQK
jgi:hypothetical protein